MITLSNGHELTYLTASGAMGFDGRGWIWEKPLVGLGFIDPTLFTHVLRSITLEERFYTSKVNPSNHCWALPWTWLPFSPWACVRLIENGVINKVGLYNPGLYRWIEKFGPRVEKSRVPLISSIFGTRDECVTMARAVSVYNVKAIEVNASCPNSGHAMDKTRVVIDCVSAVKAAVPHMPIIVKVSVDQDYMKIAEGLKGIAEAISFNSVPYAKIFPNGPKSPLEKLGKEGSGGGGVSGKAAQKENWAAQAKLAEAKHLPVIGSSPDEYDDLRKLWDKVKVDAIAFGAIHLPTKWKPWTLFTNPCKPTQFVKRRRREYFETIESHRHFHQEMVIDGES